MEYKKLLIDFDKTITYILSKNQNNGIMGNIIEEANNKMERLREEVESFKSTEDKLKNQINFLEKDIIKAEERAEAYKLLAKEKIDSIKIENEQLFCLYEDEKRINRNLEIKINELQQIINDRIKENIEVVEYCKILIKSIEDNN